MSAKSGNPELRSLLTGARHAREEARDKHGAGGSERMAASNRATVRVQKILIELEALR